MMKKSETDSTATELQALALVAVLEALPDGPPKTWLSAGVATWLDGSPLELALGLGGGQGRRTARTLYRRHLRDDALGRAHSMMAHRTPWGRTLALVDELKKFEGRIWPRWRDLEAPPARASELHSVLWRAFRAGTVPLSPSRLHEICCSCESPLFIGQSPVHHAPA